ncbi:PEP-utilizing enzyme, mobile domain protein [delta proteobacterium NaphS2]|nr:PEP-utilizing enzyme, mobile domain protein [delta proteobacterium NaphS2]
MEESRQGGTVDHPQQDYTHYNFDEEYDLDRVPYWFFGAGHTAPGYPHKPLYEWTWVNHCNRGFRYAADKLSLPYSLGLDFRSYFGYELIRCGLPSEKVKKERSSTFREGISPMIENFDELYNQSNEELMGYYRELKVFDVENASWFELELLLERLMDLDKRMWEIHMYFNCGLGAVYCLFEDLCRELLDIDDKHPLFLKLLAGFHNKGIEVDRKMFVLSQRIKELGLVDLFSGRETASELFPKVETSENGRQWLKEFNAFLWEDGWRSNLFFEYETSWIEDPTPAIITMRQFLKYDTFRPDELRPKLEAERKQAEEEILSRVQPDQRAWFKTLMNVAQKFSFENEDHQYYNESYCFALTRYLLLKVAARMVAVGTLDEAEDIFFLVPEEIHKGLADPETYRLQHNVNSHKRQWEANKKIVPPPFFGTVSIEEAGRLLFEGKEPLLTKVSIGEFVVPRPELKADLLGLCGCSGVAEGTARVVMAPEYLDAVQPGDILVAPSTSGPWTAVFSLLKGVVIDRGGTLSHAAIVGREYGIPVVANVMEGTTKIKSGQRIKVDGNVGAVYILD